MSEETWSEGQMVFFFFFQFLLKVTKFTPCVQTQPYTMFWNSTTDSDCNLIAIKFSVTSYIMTSYIFKRSVQDQNIFGTFIE